MKAPAAALPVLLNGTKGGFDGRRVCGAGDRAGRDGKAEPGRIDQGQRNPRRAVGLESAQVDHPPPCALKKLITVAGENPAPVTAMVPTICVTVLSMIRAPTGADTEALCLLYDPSLPRLLTRSEPGPIYRRVEPTYR